MTCKEKLMEQHPEIFNHAIENQCPLDFGYLDNPVGGCDSMSCKDCWDREIPEEKGIISQPIKDAMTKFGEECVKQAIEIDKVVTDKYEAWYKTLPDKFKPDKDDTESDAISEEVIEKFNESGTGCAQSPEDIRKALERAGEMLANGFADGIKDSGNRTEFASGAVRDMREGKGRCDLMPLDVIADVLRDPILVEIAKFQDDKDVKHLYSALLSVPQSEVFPDVHTMFLEVAKHFEAGCKKYGEDNWRKGIPAKCYIDSAVRHYLKFLRGDKDEPHDRAFVWNILCCIWTVKHLGYNADGGSEKKES